jgi:hypothetical protein
VVVLQSMLAAGYLGSLRQVLDTGSYDFGAAVRRYTVPIATYQLTATLFSTALAGVGLLVGSRLTALVLLALPMFLLLAYLFYPVPYLVVLRERGLVDAIRGSLGLATSGGPYLMYTLGFVAFSALVSLVGTAVVANLGPVGIVAGAVAAAPLGLALNITTLRFLADIDDASPTFGEWPSDDDGSASSTDPVTPTD